MSYRGLFQNFVAEYHVVSATTMTDCLRNQMEFAHSLLAVLTVLDRLDTSRTRRQFWYPRPLDLWLHMRGPRVSKDDREDEDGDGPVEDGELFQASFGESAKRAGAFHTESDELLGEVKKRNPENTPFNNKWLNALSYVGRATDVLHSRSFWYAIKAGAITILAALPGFLSSADQHLSFCRCVISADAAH